MAELITIDLSVEQLERFLRGRLAEFGPDAIIGFAQRASCCPMAQMILAQPGVLRCSVLKDSASVRLAGAPGRYTMVTFEQHDPRSLFIEIVDATRDANEPVTIAQAIGVLGEVIRSV